MRNNPPTLNAEPQRLRRVLSPLAVFALSFGCAVGWGSFVMPGTTFLPIAGPAGTAIGIAVGAVIMAIIGVNYAYLLNRYPDAGGTFSYTKNVFGYDHGFLSAWFLILVYLAIIWANATAIPLIFRSLLGNALRFGFHYSIAGYDIYLGEILISFATIVVFGLLTLRGTKVTALVQTVLALVLIACIAVAFGMTLFGQNHFTINDIDPSFAPEHTPATGILFIMFLAPWAFAGFESVTHSVEEYRFESKKTIHVMGAALLASAFAYIALALIASSAVPEGYASWVEYVRDLPNLSGVEGIPVFYGVYRSMGNTGLLILGVAAACGIITGLIGNLVAASRMIYAMAKDELLPPSMASLNRYGVPKNAILFLLAVSLPIPFFGRSAIGWIIDVNTIGITVAYAYTSAATVKESVRENKPFVLTSGILGVLVSIFFLFYFLVPNIWSISALSTESYLILLIWGVLGFVVFYIIFRGDPKHRLGQSTTVWIVLLLLIFMTSFIWVTGMASSATNTAVDLIASGAGASAEETAAIASEVRSNFEGVTGMILRNSVVQSLLIIISLAIVFRVYGTVRKSHQTAVEDKTIAEQSSMAKTTFLSNMSHDIRTPMNAIIGYVSLAKREKNLTPRVAEYLSKIGDSSDRLLALINDVLEMSRIESGRMELMPVPTDVVKMMDGVRDMFATQMREKNLRYDVVLKDVANPYVLCDKNRFDRVLLNLISNAYKFTPSGGSVTVTMTETGAGDGKVDFLLSVKDTGIGMSPEFAKKVFEAYERERTTTVENIQGTGLGTAITKSIVDLMGGTIDVVSEKGKGTEFVIHVSLPIDPAATAGTVRLADPSDAIAKFCGMRVLLVDDDPASRDFEKTLFEEIGFIVDTAVNGEDAVEIVAASTPGEYTAVLMDIEMPVKNGNEATRLIRSLRNPALSSIPIIAISAKAFSEDISSALDAGMNAHIAKPINMKNVVETLSDILL